MMPSLEWLPWISSPSLVPEGLGQEPDEAIGAQHLAGDMAIDTDHLARMTLGDDSLRREVLVLFDRQAEHLTSQLLAPHTDAGECAHRLNGAARAIGAFGVAEAAEAIERQIERGGDTRAAIAALDHAVAQAREAIAGLLRLS